MINRIIKLEEKEIMKNTKIPYLEIKNRERERVG